MIKPQKTEMREESLVRILSTDIPGNMSIYAGLTRVKGISWGFSHALCATLHLDKSRKIASLTKEEIDALVSFIQQPKVPSFLLNRRFDFETGKDAHLLGSNLELKKEFDIKRLKKIRSYRGLRHATGQPVRGQRTRSHFRKNKVVGVMKKAKIGKK